MALPSWLLPLALFGLGGLGVLACFGVANNLGAIGGVLDKRMAEFVKEMDALHAVLRGVAQGLRDLSAQTLVTTLGHMHLNAPAGSPELFNYDQYKHLRGDGWEWVITDRSGAVLGREAALPIEYEEIPGDPNATHWRGEDALLSEAERAARTVFPVSSVRRTECGYDIVL